MSFSICLGFQILAPSVSARRSLLLCTHVYCECRCFQCFSPKVSAFVLKDSIIFHLYFYFYLYLMIQVAVSPVNPGASQPEGQSSPELPSISQSTMKRVTIRARAYSTSRSMVSNNIIWEPALPAGIGSSQMPSLEPKIVLLIQRSV